MLQSYRAQYGLNGVFLMPANLYGPGDSFDPESCHVIPAMIRRFCDARDSDVDEVICWGAGHAGREFLFVDDAADAILRAAEVYDGADAINLGVGREILIHELATMIAELVGYKGRILWDAGRPDGQPRRRLDVSRAEALLGWRAKTELIEGLRRTIDWWESASRPNHSLTGASA
jgi:GDP-L-fucose synthase